MRTAAARACLLCGETIGYDTPFFPLLPETTAGRLAHAACLAVRLSYGCGVTVPTHITPTPPAEAAKQSADTPRAMNFREEIKVWMRTVIDATGWSANQWGLAAEVSPSTLTRFLNRPDTPIPSSRTLMKLHDAMRRHAPHVKARLVLADLTAPPAPASPDLTRIDGLQMVDATEPPVGNYIVGKKPPELFIPRKADP